MASDDAANQVRIQSAGFRKMIKGLALIEARHFDGIFDCVTPLPSRFRDPSAARAIGTTR